MLLEVKWSKSHSIISDSLRPHGLYSPWNSPGQNIGVGSLSLLQGIFPTQGLNPGLLHCRWILYRAMRKPICKICCLTHFLVCLLKFSCRLALILWSRSLQTFLKSHHHNKKIIERLKVLHIYYMYIYVAAAAKSLQSCPTLWAPIDSSPPGSAVPGILQARTLERVVISFSSA